MIQNIVILLHSKNDKTLVMKKTFGEITNSSDEYKLKSERLFWSLHEGKKTLRERRSQLFTQLQFAKENTTLLSQKTNHPCHEPCDAGAVLYKTEESSQPGAGFYCSFFFWSHKIPVEDEDMAVNMWNTHLLFLVVVVCLLVFLQLKLPYSLVSYTA